MPPTCLAGRGLFCVPQASVFLFDEFDFVAVGVFDEGDDGGAAFDGAGFTGDFAAGFADAVAGGNDVVGGEGDVAVGGSHVVL